MTVRPSPRLAAILVGYAFGAAGLVIVLGATALGSWVWGGISRGNWPHVLGPAMNPMTALGMIAGGASLALSIPKARPRSRQRGLASALAILVLAIATLKLLDYFLHVPVDRMWAAIGWAVRPMPAETVGGFLIVGAALLLLDYRTGRGHRPAVPLSLIAWAVGFVSLTAYLYGLSWFYASAGNQAMSLTSAIGFLLLGSALLAARPKVEPVATLLSDTAGGVVARRLLPAAAGIPLLIGRLCIVEAGRYDNQSLGITIFSLLMTAIFMVLTWASARFLLRVDRERQRAEQRVEEERHLLRSLIDSLPDMVFVKDREHHFLLNNKAHARALGASEPQTMLGKCDRDYFPPDAAERFRAEERQLISAGEAMVDREQTITDSAGATRFLTVTKVPLLDMKGQIAGLVGIAHDISKRKRAEEERDRFFTLSADMMCIAGFDGYFIRVNPAWEVTLGYTVEELTSHPWIDFVHPEDAAATIAEGKKLALGAVTLFFENRYRCKDGSYRWLSWTVVPVVADQRLYAVARDMTERRKAEEQLRETNQRLAEVLESELQAQSALRTAQSTMVQTEKLAGLGQMVAGVAHEINNPLSFVSNNVAVLQRDLRGMLQLIELYAQADAIIEASAPKLVEEIRSVATAMDLKYTMTNLQLLLSRSREGLKRIQQIVKDLRDFARLDESDLQEVDLNQGILSTVTIIHGYAKKKGISIDTELGDLPKVSCYPAKINQVVMNLLANAIDATPQNGRVIVRTRASDEDHVAIQVVDTGSGIDPAIRERIFDPFFTTKAPGEGTGLGLSISYGIVRDHHGTISLESSVGRGSVFTVTLPVHLAALKPQPVEETSGRPRS